LRSRACHSGVIFRQEYFREKTLIQQKFLLDHPGVVL